MVIFSKFYNCTSIWTYLTKMCWYYYCRTSWEK